ncbi:hypothetical protein [Parahaliea mediterranea]|uniref:Uncharacterized protein n=1 Tax=Parahaliea mediterranea TaxID=651086 RepID=A0A939IHU7_9GAMM|nr:hypothetical protein [Parahaliea mediterranea]MBN7795899.1 hypothetical protein [Parahaliea mediterranea]
MTAGAGEAGGAVICAVHLAPTHDGEAAMVVELRYPNGGTATVQVAGGDTAAVMARAGVATAAGLVGQPWTVLQVREVRGSG